MKNLIPPLILAALFSAFALGSMTQKSLVGDEFAHLASGYALWKKNEPILNPEHPALLLEFWPFFDFSFFQAGLG